LVTVKTNNVPWHERLTNFCTVISLMRWEKHSWLFRNKKTHPFLTLCKRKMEKKWGKKAFEWLFYSVFCSQPDFLPRKQNSKAHLSPWSSSMPQITAQLVTIHAYQNPKHSERCQPGCSKSLSWWRISHTAYTAAATTGQPFLKHNSFRGHSPLPILISLPLANESPQFPLPSRAAA